MAQSLPQSYKAAVVVNKGQDLILKDLEMRPLIPEGLVAIQGLDGLGHQAVQFFSNMGYMIVALSHGESKRDFVLNLGAHDYIDTTKVDPVEKLREMGGADMICATAPDPKAISHLVSGLATGGKLLVLAAVGNIESTRSQ
ncbi:hypothetical protein DV737_g2417, partial [Chaetothyriales sp. CBS 132003]